MRIGIVGHLALIILCCSTALISDSMVGNGEPFCLYSHSGLGRTRSSFVWRPRVSAPLRLYWTLWTEDQQVEECRISTEQTLIQYYMAFCPQKRPWDSPGGSLLLDLLLEPGGPCEVQPNAVRNLVRHGRTLDGSHQGGSKGRQKRAWVLPGTLWCGRGSSARDYEQLGMFEHVDRCCREHDHCSHVIHPFTVNFGIFNPTLFTISHCDCDHRFKQCLHNVNDSVSDMVGYTFFHILKLRCFDLIQKRRCIQLNWFGMCTSVQDAPFAIIRNPIPYNISNSDPASSGIFDAPSIETLPSANGKAKSNKPLQRRKQSKGQRSNKPAAQEEAFLLREKMQDHYVKSQSSPKTFPTWEKLLTNNNSNSIFFHQNQTRIYQKTLSVHKTKQMHQITESPKSATMPHKHSTLSQAEGFSAQKPIVKSKKKICTNKKKKNTSRSRNTTAQIKMIYKPSMSKQNCVPKKPPMDNTFQSTRKKEMDYKEDNAPTLATESAVTALTPLTSSFPKTNKISMNKTRRQKTYNSPNKNTFTKYSSTLQINKNTDPAVTFLPSVMPVLPKQKIRSSKNQSHNVTQAPKRRKQTPVIPPPTTKSRRTHWKDNSLSRTPLLATVSLPKDGAKFKDYLSAKQKTISSAVENIYLKKRRKSPKISSIVHDVAKRRTTAPRSINQKKKLTSVLKHKMVSSTEIIETLSSSLSNKTNSAFKGIPLQDDPAGHFQLLQLQEPTNEKQRTSHLQNATATAHTGARPSFTRPKS